MKICITEVHNGFILEPYVANNPGYCLYTDMRVVEGYDPVELGKAVIDYLQWLDKKSKGEC